MSVEKAGCLGSEASLSAPFAPSCSGQPQLGFKAQRRGLPAWPQGAHRGRGLGGTLQLSDSTAPFASGAAPEELHLAPSARDAPSLPLTPGGQGGAASLFKGLITSEHWASHHELRAQPRRSAQSHNGFPFNNRLSGVTPLRRGRGRKGVNTVRHCRVNY